MIVDVQGLCSCMNACFSYHCFVDSCHSTELGRNTSPVKTWPECSFPMCRNFEDTGGSKDKVDCPSKSIARLFRALAGAMLAGWWMVSVGSSCLLGAGQVEHRTRVGMPDFHPRKEVAVQSVRVVPFCRCAPVARIESKGGGGTPKAAFLYSNTF